MDFQLNVYPIKNMLIILQYESDIVIKKLSFLVGGKDGSIAKTFFKYHIPSQIY